MQEPGENKIKREDDKVNGDKGIKSEHVDSEPEGEAPKAKKEEQEDPVAVKSEETAAAAVVPLALPAPESIKAKSFRSLQSWMK